MAELGDMSAPAVQDLRPIVIIGPSGVGKGTLINRIMKHYGVYFGFTVSHTTRAPRPGEQDGVHYHFVSREQMAGDIANGSFMESAEVHGNLYGTSVQAVQAVKASNKTAVLDIDVQGARQIRSGPYGSQALLIFIAPPSLEELERRLRGRGTEDEEKIQRRLKNAEAELDASTEPDFVHHVIVNDDVDSAYHELELAISAHLPELAIAASSASTSTAAFGEIPDEGGQDKGDDISQTPAAPEKKPVTADDQTSKTLVKKYLQETVVPHVEEALLALVQTRPEDPLQFVIDHLIEKKSKLSV